MNEFEYLTPRQKTRLDVMRLFVTELTYPADGAGVDELVRDVDVGVTYVLEGIVPGAVADGATLGEFFPVGAAREDD